MMKLKQQRGFTLMEVMVTVAIVGILAAIAFPSYQDSLRKSRRTDAKNALTQAVANMERYYNQNNTYLNATMCTSTPTICATLGTCTGGVCTSTEGNYTIALSNLAANTFTVTGTPVVGGPQVVDGPLRINHLNFKEHDADNNGTWATSENYWK